MKSSTIALQFFLVLTIGFLFQSCSKDNNTIEPIPASFQPAATEDIVMYEINPGAFSSTHNIQGIIDRLDNIKALGVNTIWIMPIYPVGEVNSFGSVYCVKDYTSVRSSLGTLENLKSLVTKAHEKGIAVLLDWVANHTAWDNPWITAHPDWYTHNSSGQIISPAGTNWNDVADLNFDNTAMRLAMIEAMKYWVTEADIDGYRCDAADFVPSSFWQQAITALNTIPNKHLIVLAEGIQNDQFTAGFQMNFSWDYLTSLKNVFGFAQANATILYNTNTSEYANVPSGKRKLRFTTNHDESFLASPLTVYGNKEGALAASVVAIYMDGVPLLYCGQEVGETVNSSYTSTSSIDWSANSDMLLAYQQLLGFYTSSTAAKTGTLTNFSTSSLVVFQKSNNTDKVLVMVNPRTTLKTFTVPLELQGNWTNALTNETVTLTSSKVLASYKYLILKK